MLASSLTCIDMHNTHTYKQNKENIKKPTHTMFLGYNARVFPKVMFTDLCVFILKHIINSFSSYQNDRCITFNVIQRDCNSISQSVEDIIFFENWNPVFLPSLRGFWLWSGIYPKVFHMKSSYKVWSCTSIYFSVTPVLPTWILKKDRVENIMQLQFWNVQIIFLFFPPILDPDFSFVRLWVHIPWMKKNS